MCGIVGFTGNKNRYFLEKMNSTIKHRGPDSEYFYETNILSFAMRRLAIIDIENGHQPYFSQDKSVIAIFNGEIYNYKILKNELEKDNFSFLSDSDGEIIPNLYLKYGINFVHKINGMFAIALYDKKINKLFLFRDRMGKKPLYYTTIKNKFYFASEIKSLLQIDFNFQIDINSLINYLQLKHTSAPNTIYKEIKQLLPASYLEYDLDNEKFHIKQYWNIDFSTKLHKNVKYNIISLLEDAVKLRINCDVEYGAYLSGGLDSSLVTSIIVKKYSNSLKTFSLGYKDDFKNKQSDIFFARKLSKELGTKHYEYILDSKEVFDNLEKVLMAFDEPFGGTISTYFLSNLISKHVKVAISGDGSDELFGSYLTHRLSTPMEYYLKYNTFLYDIPIYEKEIIKKIASKNIFEWRNKLNVFNDNELKLLFNNSINLTNPYSKLKLTSKSMIDKCLEIDQKELLSNQILPFIDRLSMAHSVEVRSPFLDYRLVEYVAKIPSYLKINKSINKYILKQIASKYLKDDIIHRPKEGFVLPVYKWIEKDFLDIVIDTILNSKMIIDFNFNKKYIEYLLSIFKKEKKEHAKIWNLYSLAVWHKGIE